MLDVRSAIMQLATQQYGPLYVVCHKNPLESTPSVFLLNPGQKLERERSAMPDVPHSDLLPHQEIFGRVPGTTVWSSDEFGWKPGHPKVKDGSAKQLVEKLITANETAMGLGMHDFWARQLWLADWANNYLDRVDSIFPLPNLDP